MPVSSDIAPPTPMANTIDSRIDTFLADVRRDAESAGVFGVVEVLPGQSGRPGMLRASAPRAAAEAWYRIRHDGGAWCVEFVTPDRWLSESIEADLMHHGDPIEELVEEELAELDDGGRDGSAGDAARGRAGAAVVRPVVQHFRSEDLLYTFRTALPGEVPEASEASRFLRAYEAAFRELGDVEADPGER
ncbi:MAG: hypothetical protein U0575_05830 [Phycisphaerales bacterium]